jgi:CheY-like chemotaxis protein
MVVEDDGVNRAAISEILESIGYQVVQVEDGLQALSALEANSGQFNLIISDVVMPNMGGKDLHEAVTKHYPEIHMILMTGYPLGQETRKLFDRSRVTWLQKPLESEVLAQTVRKILG